MEDNGDERCMARVGRWEVFMPRTGVHWGREYNTERSNIRWG